MRHWGTLLHRHLWQSTVRCLSIRNKACNPSLSRDSSVLAQFHSKYYLLIATNSSWKISLRFVYTPNQTKCQQNVILTSGRTTSDWMRPEIHLNVRYLEFSAFIFIAQLLIAQHITYLFNFSWVECRQFLCLWIGIAFLPLACLFDLRQMYLLILLVLEQWRTKPENSTAQIACVWAGKTAVNVRVFLQR